MLKEFELTIGGNYQLKLPQELIKLLPLKQGDTVRIIADESVEMKCFKIESDNEKELFEEDFYCIPRRIFEQCDITYDDILVLLDKGNITLTSGEHIIGSLGAELISCLMEQDIDLGMLADDLVDSMNEHAYEKDI